MEVKILETSIISPSRPTFDHDHVLPLSHLDQDRNVQVTIRTLRAYANNPNSSSSLPSDPAHVISQALSKALPYYYPVAGTLRRRSTDNRLELSCRAEEQGVPFIRATAECTLASVNYLDDPVAHFLEQLVPDPRLGEELLHPLIIQVTIFSCGGFSLGMCIYHSMCDGLGSTVFLNAVAELARGACEPSIEPVWDRSGLLGPRNPPRVEFQFHEFLQLDKESFPYSAPTYNILRECFPVKDECINRFKALLSQKSGSTFTTFEALGAFIWQAKVKASGIPGDEKVKFVYSTNIRKQLNPPLPSGYWGNGCVPVYVQLIARDLVARPIWETAEKIKESKRNITDEYVRSFIDFQQLYYEEGITAGKGVSGFTDWRHLGHSTVDFGWGSPVTVQPLSWNLLGSVEPCFFLPYSSASESKDGFKVLVSLPEAAIPAFRVEMERLSSVEELF
ncbi:HXXXD-type acyl-transferase family protein [Tasmannia lanceolata]|uniref:HXXXD-type acyl-transferase family protein n=1 Tax=Tasmannia lanceolata TaxID=3420 RepID=UPI004062AC85